MSTIREVSAGEKAPWLLLWKGYIEFYKSTTSDEQDDLTWVRLLDQSFNLHCLVAEVDGEIQGIAHYSFQTSTRAPKNYCYLEDLYVNPHSRGRGLGRELIDAVLAIALKSGSSRFYWNTDATNETARKLYDSYTTESGKVQYRIALPGSQKLT